MLNPIFASRCYPGMMTASRLWGILLASLLAVLALAPVQASAETVLAPCVGAAPGTDLHSPYGPAATSFVCDADQSRHGSGDFKVDFLFDPVVPSPDDPTVFRMASVWQDTAQIRFRYADGAERRVDFTSQNASRWLQFGAIYQFPVPRHDAALTGIEISTQGTANLRGVVLGAALMPRSSGEAMNRRLIAMYAGFLGLSLALIVYNLALWGALRHRFQLIYCAMVAAITAYMFTSSGAIMLTLPDLANNDRLRMNYVLLGLTGLTAMWFVRSFFESGVLPRWFQRVLDGLSVIALVSAMAFAAFAPAGIRTLDRIYFSTLGLILLMIIPILYFAWHNNSRFRWMFFLAWSAPILTSLARVLHGFGFIPYSFWLDNGNLIALAVEALFSSVLITQRLRDLSSERDLARAGEKSAMRLANSDPLTGLLNRRAFLDLVIGRTEPHRLFLLDIDRFKQINDRIGHDAGDQVLREVAQALQDLRPGGSLAVRLGGEEFALLIPVSRQGECTSEQILLAVRNRAMPLGIKVTASIGFADGRVGTDEDWRKLYRLADSALNRAKADGRDRACRATDFAKIAAA